MKKTVSVIALFAILILFLSASADRAVQAAEGSVAPVIELNDSATDSTAMTDFSGRWTLINFWDSCDPVSRIAASDYDALARRLDSDDDFQLLSVNLDSSEEVYREISRRDGLTEGIRVNIDLSRSPRLRADYYLDRGNSSYLVDPSGVIVAVNPTPAQVATIMERRLLDADRG